LGAGLRHSSEKQVLTKAQNFKVPLRNVHAFGLLDPLLALGSIAKASFHLVTPLHGALLKKKSKQRARPGSTPSLWLVGLMIRRVR
jgi:hypothetical protein